ncbi:MAG TPA: hypothetical protein VL651_16570, partial [Bacteroidia bacterium]|nr:hypothetical protein [Bacteroidia bacterium]
KGKSRFERFLHNTFARDINYQDTTVERFVELTAAINYEKLLGTRCIQNKDEIMIGVMGITIDRLGLNPYEVYPNKRFVADFGIQ